MLCASENHMKRNVSKIFWNIIVGLGDCKARAAEMRHKTDTTDTILQAIKSTSSSLIIPTVLAR